MLGIQPHPSGDILTETESRVHGRVSPVSPQTPGGEQPPDCGGPVKIFLAGSFTANQWLPGTQYLSGFMAVWLAWSISHCRDFKFISFILLR